MSQTRFGVLGPVRVCGPAGTAELVGRVQRTLAGLLVLHAGSVVSSDRLTLTRAFRTGDWRTVFNSSTTRSMTSPTASFAQPA